MTSSDSLLQPRSTRKAWLWLLIAATQCQVLHGVQQRYSTAAPDNYKVFVYPPLEINNFVQCSNVHGHGGGSWNVSGEKPFERVTDCAQTQDGCRPDDKHNVDVFFVRAVTSPTFKTVPAADAKLFVVPFLCTQSGWHSACGNHGSNMRHLAAYLQRSPWFQRHGGADHFILCDRMGGKKVAKCISRHTSQPGTWVDIDPLWWLLSRLCERGALLRPTPALG